MTQDYGFSRARPYEWRCGFAVAESESDAGIRRLLVPTDFSPCSQGALRQAVNLARDWRATITLLYVVDLNLHTPPTAPVDSEQLKADLWTAGLAHLGQTIMQLAGQGVEVATVIREGLPSEQIVEAARRYDLIVIGQRKPKPFWGLFSRHTVQAVLNAAPCPVLVVREKALETHAVK